MTFVARLLRHFFHFSAFYDRKSSFNPIIPFGSLFISPPSLCSLSSPQDGSRRHSRQNIGFFLNQEKKTSGPLVPFLIDIVTFLASFSVLERPTRIFRKYLHLFLTKVLTPIFYPIPLFHASQRSPHFSTLLRRRLTHVSIKFNTAMSFHLGEIPLFISPFLPFLDWLTFFSVQFTC